MATQERTLLYLDENDQHDWSNLNIVASEPEINAINYLHDLKNTLEFDRHCRTLEVLFNDLQDRLHAVEIEISKLK